MDFLPPLPADPLFRWTLYVIGVVVVFLLFWNALLRYNRWRYGPDETD